MVPLGHLFILIFLYGEINCGHRFPRHGTGYDDGSYSGGDYSAIPGNPGIDYPTLGPHPPITNFPCQTQAWIPGYYADTAYNCQVYHICEAGGKDNVFLCPNGTIFNQQYFVCDWWYNVDCALSTSLYFLNGNLYQSNTNSFGGTGGSLGGLGGGGLGGGGFGSSTTGFYK